MPRSYRNARLSARNTARIHLYKWQHIKYYQWIYITGSNRIYETGIQFKSDWIKSFYILRHQIAQYPAVNNNADLEFLNTPQCKVRNSSYEFAVISKNKILRDFWETQSLKNGLNRRFWKKIARLRLRHFRFESLLRVYNAIKPVKTFCQVFKVEICKANTTVTWQVVIPRPKPRDNLFRVFLCPNTAFYGGIRAFSFASYFTNTHNYLFA